MSIILEFFRMSSKILHSREPYIGIFLIYIKLMPLSITRLILRVIYFRRSTGVGVYIENAALLIY
jgi:hypothetical protein